MLLHKIYAIFILPSIVLAYDLLCPDVSQRQLRSQVLCTRKNDTNTVYTCLEDVNKETYNESCSEKEGVVRPGRKYVYVRLATSRECSSERYQPIPFKKSSGAMCLFLKSTCHEVGQMVAKNGQSFNDTTCICDFTEGYAYVTRPSDPCNCVPSEEDCTCYEKLCPESHLLSSDYECIHRNAPSVTTCDTIYKSEKKFTTTTPTTVGTDSTAFNESPTRIKNGVSPAMSATVIMIVLLLIQILYVVFVKKCTEAKILAVMSKENMVKSDEEIILIGIWLLVNFVAPKAVRNLFDKNFPPVSLTNKMKREEPKLEALLADEQLTKAQMKLLFPATGATSSSMYDIPLMICLLHNLTTIRPPVNGFDVLPPSTEIHVGADLARVKYYSNKIYDSELDRIPTSEFTTIWNDLKQAVDRLEISNLKTMCGDSKDLCLSHDTSLKLPDNTSRQIQDENSQLKETVESWSQESAEKLSTIKKYSCHELPAAVRQLSEEDINLYLEIIKSGTETRYYIRVVIIGENGVGKTCLLRRLLEEPIGDVKSTDGIDVVHRCKISLSNGQWIIDKDTNKRKDILTRINTALNAKTSENQQNQPRISKENRQAEMTKRSGEGKIEGTKLLAPSTDDKDKKKVTEPSTLSTDDKNKSKVTEPLAPSKDDEDKMDAIKPSTFSLNDEKQGNSDVLNNEMKSIQVKNAKKKIATRLEKTLTKINLNKLSQFIDDKERNVKEVLVDLGFWDFSGQKEYYPTHPIFLNPNAVHLLVSDITKDIKKMTTEGGYDQIGEYIDFWFDSILSCRDVDDTKDSTGDHLNPPVIVVCTGIDKCKDKLEEEKKFRQQLTTLLEKKDKRKHLRSICYISNTEPAEKDFDYLRQSIFECGKTIETVGEKLPLKWIQLEQVLNILCETDINVISWVDMAFLASVLSIQDEKELDLFLKYHHKIGNIIYFESLKDHIILSQKWLADAFRCFIADEEKYDQALIVSDEWKTLEDTGELKPWLIVKLLEKEKDRQFDKYKDHILEVMEMFGIIFKLSDEKQNVPTYYMPCMISKKTSMNQVCDVFGVSRHTCRRTPWLCIQFDFMPFDFFNHILYQYTKIYSLCTEASSERKAIYHGIGVFDLDKAYSNKFILCFSKNTIAMQIWQWTNLEQGKCKSMLEELKSVIHRVMYTCETRRVSYTVKTKCADGDIHITAGRKSYTELTGDKTYFCEEHQQMHYASDSFQTWFENYSENIAKEEREDNFIRIFKLVYGVAPQAVRKIFDKYFPPISLATILKQNDVKLEVLVQEKCLTTTQMTLLFPNSGDTSSSEFDVNLMICLLRNFTLIPPPVNGFDVLPPGTDTSEGADLARVKYYRNKIAFSAIDRLPKSEFTTVWNDLEQALFRLGGSDVKAMCDDIKNMTLCRKLDRT